MTEQAAGHAGTGGPGRVVGAAVRRSRMAPGLVATFIAGVLVATALSPKDDDASVEAAAPAAATPGASVADPTVGAPAVVDTGTSVAGAPAAGPTATAPGTAGPAPATAASGTSSAPPSAASAPSGGNGGATFRGVTEKTIKLTHLTGDSNTIGAVCPRCGNAKAGTEGGAVKALIAAWKRDGMLPIYGRDLEVTTRPFELLSAEQTRNSCVQAAQVDKPFLVVAGNGQSVSDCVAREFKYILMSGQTAGDDDFLRATPRIVQVYPTRDKTWRNYVAWLDLKGLLKGQVIGMYSPADASTGGIQKNLTKSFRQPLEQRGYKLAVDMTYDFTQSASTDNVAVQRFLSAGVTVAIIIGALTEPSGFQHRAEALRYRPKYPIAETGNETTDAVADVSYNVDAEDGNIGLRAERWEWKQRRPAVPTTPTAAYCLKAYQDFYKKTLDVFDNDAEIHTIQHDCAAMEVMRQAMLNAGPNLTETSFFQGLYKIKNFETSDIARVSYGPGKHAGSDVYADAKHSKARWQPHNNYWNTTSAWYTALVP